MKVDIHEIGTDKSLIKKYIDFPHSLYEGDPHYVPELFMAQKELFDRKKNPFFEHSEVASFLAMSGTQVIGRISAIRNNNYNAYHKTNVGFFGFFDVINDYDVCKALLDHAVSWIKEQGFTAVIGPTNFSTNDTAGILIDGFHEPPKIMMTYNKPYYGEFMERYGFRNYGEFMERYGFRKEMDFLAYILYTDKASEKSIKLAQALEERLRRQGIVIRPITPKSLKEDVEHVRGIWNEAWAENWGFVPMTDRETKRLADELKLILSPKWCYIAEDNGVPIGFSVTLFNINEITKDFKKGRLLPFNVLKLLRKRKKTDYVRIIALGVNPKYRRRGIEAIFFAKNILQARESNVIAGEVSWVLENNQEMNASALKLNSELYKTYRLYQYDFDV